MPLIARSFVFVRHGETFHNRARLIAGSHDVVLTARGKRQAIEAGQLLAHWQGEIVASSAHFRARQTARLAMPGYTVETFQGLCERNWGALELGPVISPMPYIDPPGDAEHWDIFVERIGRTLNHLLEHYDHPLVVAHSGVFRVIRQLTQGTHEGPSVPNATPVHVLPPDDSYDEWRLLPITSSDDLKRD